VHNADDQPFSNSSVTPIALDGKSRPSRTGVDDEGNFRFTGLRPGKYILFAWEEVDEDLWQDPKFRKKYEATQRKSPSARGNRRWRNAA